MSINGKTDAGITLMETVVGIAVFGIIAAATYQALWSVQNIIRQANAMLVATALANEQVERIRGLPYEHVGIVGGFPDGVLEREQAVIRSGWAFEVTTTIRNIDDPQFGPEGAANYKLVHLDITCNTCKQFPPVSVTTYVAPPGLEETPGGGLFVQVFNARGDPLAGAQVTVQNNNAEPPFTVQDITDNTGILRLVGVPEGVGAYEITVSGNGYSASRTYAEDEFEGGSIPLKPHATVVAGQVTAISFSIDKVSTLRVETRDDTCNVSPGVPFTLTGSKIIAVEPDVLKYEADHNTDLAGNRTLVGMEWDDYLARITGSVFSLAGTIPFFPYSLSPDTEGHVTLVTREHNPNELLVTVLDAVTEEAISGATVTITVHEDEYEHITGETEVSQSDWSGGPGQPGLFEAENQYWQGSDGIVHNNPQGAITLRDAEEGVLTSSVFDVGAPASFSRIAWDEETPPGTSVRFQLAMKDAFEVGDELWDFVGPDGTSNTFYENSEQNISNVHEGKRYFRYRVFLTTNNQDIPPVVTHVGVAFSNMCVPSGQAFFQELGIGTHTIAVVVDGYTPIQDNVLIDNTWQRYDVALQPE